MMNRTKLARSIPSPFGDYMSSDVDDWDSVENNLEWYRWALTFPGYENYLWKDIANQPIPFYIFFEIYGTNEKCIRKRDLQAFKSNRHQCWENGLEYGIVYNFDADGMMQATKAAEFVVSMLNELSHPPQLPIFCKISKSFARKSLSYKFRSQLVSVFCETIECYGYKAGIQVSDDFYRILEISELCRYDMWLVAREGKGASLLCDKCAVQYKRFVLNPLDEINRKTKIDVYGSIFFTSYASHEKHYIGWNSGIDPIDGKTIRTRYYIDHIHCISNRWLCIHGDWYCFDMAGNLITDVYYKYNNRWYYLSEDGYLVPGMKDPTQEVVWYFHLCNGRKVIKCLEYSNDASRMYPILKDNATYRPAELENIKLWSSHIAFYEHHRPTIHSQL